MCHHESTHWRHLANTVEPSICCGNAALCQITLATYFIGFENLSFKLLVCFKHCDNIYYMLSVSLCRKHDIRYHGVFAALLAFIMQWPILMCSLIMCSLLLVLAVMTYIKSRKIWLMH